MKGIYHNNLVKFFQILTKLTQKTKRNLWKILTEILTRIGEDDTPFKFEFFTGGKNTKI